MSTRDDNADEFRDQLKGAESEIIKAFDRVIHADYPNPQRIGCPGTRVLSELAAAPELFHDQGALKHIGCCAPCLDELRALRRAATTPQPG